jgi:hypothetical protein
MSQGLSLLSLRRPAGIFGSFPLPPPHIVTLYRLWDPGLLNRAHASWRLLSFSSRTFSRISLQIFRRATLYTFFVQRDFRRFFISGGDWPGTDEMLFNWNPDFVHPETLVVAWIFPAWVTGLRHHTSTWRRGSVLSNSKIYYASRRITA